MTETLSVLRRDMKRRAFVTGAGREDRWEYPEEAIRELIANAVIHRDYHPLTRGTPVSGRQYPDRVKVTNPGELHGAVSLEELTTGRGVALVTVPQAACLKLPSDEGPASVGNA